MASKISQKLSDLAYNINWAEDMDLAKLRGYVETLSEICVELAERVEVLENKSEDGG